MAVYLDHNATTPLTAGVLEAMLPYFGDQYANPSSLHFSGRCARAAVEQAREQVAALVNAHHARIIFTSGATEANNLAIKGWAATGSGAAIAVSASEHASILMAAQSLRRCGHPLHFLPVDACGQVEPGAVEHALMAGVRMLSVMMANNETGVLQDIAALSDCARRYDALMHTDAAQAAGKIEIDFKASGVQMMSLSAHKLYGPKGMGALIVDKSVTLDAQLHGGGHESGLRAGTENVAGIVGFGAAAEIARTRLSVRHRRLRALRDYLEASLHQLPSVVLFAEEAVRLPNTICLAVPGVDGEMLVMALDREGIAVSSGSSCSSGSTDPSHVLLAMGISPEQARCAVRISLGEGNSRADIDCLVQGLRRQIEAAKSLDFSCQAAI